MGDCGTVQVIQQQWLWMLITKCSMDDTVERFATTAQQPSAAPDPFTPSRCNFSCLHTTCTSHLLLPIVPCAGQPLCPSKRRKWCDVPKHLEGMTLSPDHVYTFHIWQHLIDFSSYKLSVGRFMNVDLAAVLNGQPLQLTVIDTKVRHSLWVRF